MSAVHDLVVFGGTIWALLLVLAFLLAAIRGPSLLERILAVDALSMCVVGVLALLALEHREPGYLDGALALALLGFVGTLVSSRFRARGHPF